jgi:hypothetical protein
MVAAALVSSAAVAPEGPAVLGVFLLAAAGAAEPRVGAALRAAEEPLAGAAQAVPAGGHRAAGRVTEGSGKGYINGRVDISPNDQRGCKKRAVVGGIDRSFGSTFRFNETPLSIGGAKIHLLTPHRQTVKSRIGDNEWDR